MCFSVLQVIGMLYEAQIDAQVNAKQNVVKATIDNVLEILQTTELFVPQVQTVKEEDPLTNDYVGGLCDVSENYYRSVCGPSVV